MLLAEKFEALVKIGELAIKVDMTRQGRSKAKRIWKEKRLEFECLNIEGVPAKNPPCYSDDNDDKRKKKSWCANCLKTAPAHDAFVLKSNNLRSLRMKLYWAIRKYKGKIDEYRKDKIEEGKDG